MNPKALEPILYTRNEAAKLLEMSVSQLDAEARRARVVA